MQDPWVWLALVAAQSQLGRLDEGVRAHALDIIDNDRGLELWEEAGEKELGNRKALAWSGLQTTLERELAGDST